MTLILAQSIALGPAVDDNDLPWSLRGRSERFLALASYPIALRRVSEFQRDGHHARASSNLSLASFCRVHSSPRLPTYRHRGFFLAALGISWSQRLALCHGARVEEGPTRARATKSTRVQDTFCTDPDSDILRTHRH